MDSELFAALFQHTAVARAAPDTPGPAQASDSSPSADSLPPSPPPRPLTKEQAEAFVIEGGLATGGLRSMRCSTCREVKPIDAKAPGGFPPSCVTWRRGSCRSCRAKAAKTKPLVAKKLESARHRFGSVKSVTPRDVERLVQDAGLDSSDDLKRYCLAKRDASLPFTVDNAMWVTTRQSSRV
jgi:hypothetical protein